MLIFRNIKQSVKPFHQSEVQVLNAIFPGLKYGLEILIIDCSPHRCQAQQDKFYLVITTFFTRRASAHSPRLCFLAIEKRRCQEEEEKRTKGFKFFKNHPGFNVIQRDAMFHNGAAHRCPCSIEKKGARCLLLPHLLRLRPVRVALYALCIKENVASQKYGENLKRSH